LQELLKSANFGGVGGKDSLFTKPLETLKWWYNAPFELYDNEYHA